MHARLDIRHVIRSAKVLALEISFAIRSSSSEPLCHMGVFSQVKLFTAR